MAKRLVVTDGQDPLTKPILDYLDAWYGIPHGDIRAITLESATGDVQLVTVTLLVHAKTEPGLVTEPPDLTEAEAEEFKRSWREQFTHPAGRVDTSSWTPSEVGYFHSTGEIPERLRNPRVFGPSPDYDSKDPG
jgi:hypothetical protein